MADYQGKLTGAQIDALPGEISKKQERLSVTSLDNGNVRIDFGTGITKDFMPATPSGDPLHYAYEAAGAVWNPSTGYWEYRAKEGGLVDLTNDDMRVCYSEAWLNSSVNSGVFFNTQARTTINYMVWTATYNFDNSIRGTNLEVVFLRGRGSSALPKSMIGTLCFCPKLKVIADVIDLQYNASDVELRNCPLLTTVWLKNAKKSIILSASSKLSIESLLYMINNAAPTSQIIIKLHPVVYSHASTDPEVVAALAAQPLVTLASA